MQVPECMSSMAAYAYLFTHAGLADDTYAVDHVPRSTECEQVMYQHVSLKTLIEDKEERNLPLTKAVWRVHVQQVQAEKGCVRAEMEVTLHVGGSRLGARRVVLRRPSVSRWIDLDLTAALQAIWPLHANWSEVRVQTSLRCRKACKGIHLPLRMVDLRMVTGEEREGMIALQPVLALHLRNDEAWKSIRQSLELQEARARTKRSEDAIADLHASHCRKESYTIQFSTIPYLRDVVIIPKEYDIGKCVGLCRYETHRTGRPEHFIKNHGLVLTLLQLNPDGWPGSDEPNVTCVPITYRTVQLIIQKSAAVESIPYVDFEVAECGCR